MLLGITKHTKPGGLDFSPLQILLSGLLAMFTNIVKPFGMTKTPIIRLFAAPAGVTGYNGGHKLTSC
jgi:hypothetical protein